MKVSLGKKIGVALAVTSLALVGCGQQQGGTQGQSDTGDDAGLPSTDWNRVERDQVQDGGTLTIGTDDLPPQWNQLHADGAYVPLTDITRPTGYDSFLLADEHNSLKVNPNYLESAEVTSEDPQIVTVKFNKDAKWEDGTPITIEDLKSQFKALSGQDPAYEVASTKNWEDVKEVRQTDDEFTGEIEFAKKNADWMTVVYPDLPKEVTADPDTFNKGYVDTPVPSKGPFKVANIDKNGGVVTLEQNPQWWGEKPKLEKIIFKALSQVQAASAFANAEVDAVKIGNADQYATASGRADAEMKKSNGLVYSQMTLQAETGPLADVKVREAAARAVNREAMGASISQGLETPVVLVNNAIYMPGQEGYEDSYGDLKNDPEKAKSILDEAGWTEGSDGVREKDGEKLAISVIVPAETKSNADRAAQIQKDLNAVGFSVELKTVPSDQYFKDYVNKKNFDIVTFSWQGTSFPINSAANIFYPADSEQNYTGIADEEMGPLIEQAMTELDPAKRIETANQFSEVALKQYAMIPFYATPEVWGLKTGLANYGPSQFESIDWANVGWTA